MIKRKLSKENMDEYVFPFSLKADLQKYAVPEVDANILFLTTTKFSLKEYGFKFKEFFGFNDPLRQVKDLWGWLKKLRNLKESNPLHAEILSDLKKYLDCNWSHETFLFKNYLILKANLPIFEILGWTTEVNFETDRLGLMNKNIKPNSPDLIKHISSFVLNFKFQKAIEEIEKCLISKDTFHNLKELKFINEHLKLYAEFFGRTDPDFASFEYKVLARCVQSIELETPYLRLIQIFLSKKFMEVPNIVMEMQGINFFDRVLFITRFQYKQAPDLLDSYLLNSQKVGNLDCISMFTNEPRVVKTIIETYLEKTKDIITIGLAGIILFELFGWSECEGIIEQMMSLLSAKNPNLCGVIYKEQLLLRKEINRQTLETKKTLPNIVYRCYFCKKEPGRLNLKDSMVKSNCELKR